MLAKTYNYLKNKANMGNIFLAIIIQTLFQLILVVFISPEIGKYSAEYILDLRIYYTGNEIFNYFTQLGEEGRKIYLYNIMVDMVYPFAYTAAFLLLDTYLGIKSKIRESLIRLLYFLPLLLFITDILENTGSLGMILMFPERNFFYLVGGYLTLIKQGLLILNILSISLIGLIALKNQLMVKK